MKNNRAGTFFKEPSGYYSFVPKKLPPDPPIKIDSEMLGLLSKADRMLGRLDGVTTILPDPGLFVAMYVRKEAVLSSQIEGTQASLTDILEIDETTGREKDVDEVVNYVHAMNYGLKHLKELPLSLRLIKDIHAVLLQNVRGSSKNPGEFRKTQNWIGPAGCALNDATFVPPSVPNMMQSLYDLEEFFYIENSLPPLIKIALIHAQFESIHPFLDGNGRMGRLLITFWLCQQEILSQPLLYLSYYFKQSRNEYYDRLMEVRKTGDWEGWIKYFLKGVASISEESTNSAKDILELKTDCENLFVSKSFNINYNKTLEYLFRHPVIMRTNLSDDLDFSPPTAGKIVQDLCKLNILQDTNPEKERYKKYAFLPYISILNRGTEI